MTLFDAGAFADPLISGVNGLLQILVGDDIFWQLTPSASYASIDHVTASSAWLK